MWGWIGTITGIIGGLLIALKFELSKFGYIFFMMSVFCWIIQGVKNKDKALVIINIFFIFINAIGIYNWFF